MRRAGLAVLTVLALGALAGCGDGSSKASDADTPSASGSSGGSAGSGAASGVTCTYSPDGQKPAKQATAPPKTPTVSGTVTATLDTSVGTFTFDLDADNAPCTVNSFVSLAGQGYFDGSTCHRLTDPEQTGIAVLQCGDPSGTGGGSPGYIFPDELSGSETYGPGTLAMANRGADTNGSQFFIVYADTSLPPSYTVFGKVDAATLALVQKVAADGTDNAFGQGDGHPLTAVDISKVTVG